MIQSAMLKALADASDYESSLDDLRLPHLSCWLGDKTIEGYLELYERLADQQSKDVFLRLLRNSIGWLLAGNIPPFRNYTDGEWQNFVQKARGLTGIPSSYDLDLVETYILEGYKYGDICAVTPGDIVLDCGAYTGNTAIYFADQATQSGHVHAFEPMPETYSQLAKNVKESGRSHITPWQMAASANTGNVNFVAQASPGSKKIESGGISIPAMTIDDFVRTNGIAKVDFIKMDVECSEKDALEGGRGVIQKFKPKLAICIYHLSDDFIAIPRLILDIMPDYKFYMKHNSNIFYETVLFAVPAPSTPPPPDQGA